MAGIDVKRFVNVNITTKTSASLVGTRQVTVLFTGEGTADMVRTVNASDYTGPYTPSSTPTTKAYLDVYFANGGAQCKVIEGIAYNADRDVLLGKIAALNNEEIVIAFAIPEANVEAGYDAVKNLASSYTGTGVAQKIFIARTAALTNEDAIPRFAVKYSTVLGAEMTIAAYLSRIDVYGTNTVNDYAFTQESLTAENLSDTDFGTLMSVNENVDITLAGAVRNLGGNCTDGADLVNTFVLIVLQQTVTARLLALLTTKIKNSRGLAQIYSTLAQELENYRTCGYLSTDKSWDYDTYQVIYNSVTYTIIEKGTPLVSGYFIRVLPLAALSAEDKAAKKAPPVYVILADQYGIRKIEITGEVI